MNPSIIHMYIAKKIKDDLPHHSSTRTQQQMLDLLWRNKIPKRCYLKFLKELEQLGFIKRVNKQKMDVLTDADVYKRSNNEMKNAEMEWFG